MRSTRVISACLMALLLTGCVARSELPLPLWPALHYGKLDNGLTYYVLRQPYPLTRAQTWLAVNAGSVQEDEDQRGLAHFVEHMAFNGTAHFPGSAIVDWAERIGMAFGPHVNASTHYDQTIYTLEVPTDAPEHLATALAVLRDWAGDISFEPDAIEHERGVVLEEWRLQLGAGERISNAHLPVIFAGSRYAERQPIGQKDIIEHASRDALVRFYQDWYRPDLMAVIVVGDIDPDAVVADIRERFGDLPKRDAPRPRPDGGVPSSDGPRVSIVTDKELPRASISVYDLVGHRPEATRGDFRRQLLEVLWGTMMSERLGIIELREDAPFEDPSVGTDTITRDVDGLIRSAVAKPGRIEDALRGVMTEVVRAERYGFSDAELERARTRLQRFYQDYESQFATTPSATFADEITRNFFEHELVIGPVVETRLTLELLPTYTQEDLASIAQSFGGASHRVIEISAPDDEKVPTKERALAILDEVAHADIAPWRDQAGGTTLVPEPPDPGTIVNEARIEPLDVTVWTLSNGMKVMVKPTDFAIDQVTIVGTSPGGLSVYDDATYTRARLAEAALAQGGVGQLDQVTLARLLTGKEAFASTVVGDTTESILAGSSVKDLETIFQLVWLRVTSPRVDPVAVRTWAKSATDQLAVALRSPETRFGYESAEALVQAHPRKRRLTASDYDGIDLEQALAFHKDRFGDVSDFTVAIVGAVDLKTLRPLVERWLASLPGGGRVESEQDRGVRIAPGQVTRTWNLGTEDKAAVQLWLHGDAAWTRDDERDLRILADVLSIRLREVLREDMGGVYGVSVSPSYERRPLERWLLSISFGCAPARVDALLDALWTEAARIAKDGVSDDILGKLRQQALRGREIQLTRNDTWAGWLLACALMGDDPTTILDPEPYLKRLTSDNVAAAAKRYLTKDNVFQAVMLPTTK